MDLVSRYRRLHIFGASGCGATTLGHALSARLPHTLLDGDDYFWIHKFDEARPPEERANLLSVDIGRPEQGMLTGAVCGWGDVFKPCFDFVVFLYVPPEERMARLKAREIERYGDEVLSGGRLYKKSQAFLEWAALYDHAGEEVRSLKLHERWMNDLSCPILRMEGTGSVEERVEQVWEAISK